MAYISRDDLMDVARDVWEMAQYYKTRERGELTVDRLLYGRLRGAGHYVERQTPIRSQRGNRRIDFLAGGSGTGAFIELVVRKGGSEWYRTQNGRELNKLCRAPGTQRALMIIDTSGRTPLTRAQVKADYATWRSTPGRYRRRSICLVYTAGPGHTFALGLRVTRVTVSVEE